MSNRIQGSLQVVLSAALVTVAACKPRADQASALRSGAPNDGDDAAFVASCGESRLYVMNEKPGGFNPDQQETAIALTDDTGNEGFALAGETSELGKNAHAAFDRGCTAECHTKRTSSGRLGEVTNYTVALKMRSDIKRRVLANEMPPASATVKLTEADRKTILEWTDDPQPFPGQGGVTPLASSGNAIGYKDDDSALDDSLAFISPAAQVRCIQQDFERVPSIDRQFIRYVSFTHLYNAGIRKKDYAIMKKAFYKAMNSVSRSNVVKSSGAIPIDTTTMTIFRVDLRAFKISAATWAKLPLVKTSEAAKINPYTVGRGFTGRGTYAGTGGDLSAILPLRGDFLMKEMLQRDKYYELLGIDKITDEATFYSSRMGGASETFSIAELRNSFDAKRAIFNDSPVNNGGYRVVEKIETPQGMAWNLFDFDRGFESTDPHRDPTIAPIGPCFPGAKAPFVECNKTSKWTFAHDVTETSFQLPNGLFAYLTFERDGKLSQENKVSVDPVNIEHKNVAGLSCISCHDVGLMPFKDAVGNQARKDLATKVANKYYGEVTDVVSRIHPDPQDFNDYLNVTNSRYYTALGLIGISPNEISPEPIALVVSSFEKPLTRLRAAAELGISEDELVAAVQSNEQLRSLLSVFLNNQTLARDQWQDRFLLVADLVNSYYGGGQGGGQAGGGSSSTGGTPTPGGTGGGTTPTPTPADPHSMVWNGEKFECPRNNDKWSLDTCARAIAQSRHGFLCVPCGGSSGGWAMVNLDTKRKSSCYTTTNTVCTLASSRARGGGVCIPVPNSTEVRWGVFTKEGTLTGSHASVDACYANF